MKNFNLQFIVCCGLLFISATFVQAATKGRIMTDGKVQLFKNDRLISTYTNQGPLDENALMLCEKNCIVKMQGISLTGVDQTRFAVKDSKGAVDLYIEQGKIYFVIYDVSHQFSFFTPDGSYIQSEGFIAPASTGSSIKGSVEVTDKDTVIAMDSGSMIVQTQDGTRTVKPGQALVLAMANPPEEDEGNNPRGGVVPCGLFEMACKTPFQQMGIVAAGAGITLGVGTMTYLNTNDNDQSQGSGSASPNQ